MKGWHKLKPELFNKQPYYLPGCDTYVLEHHLCIDTTAAGGNASLLATTL